MKLPKPQREYHLFHLDWLTYTKMRFMSANAGCSMRLTLENLIRARDPALKAPPVKLLGDVRVSFRLLLEDGIALDQLAASLSQDANRFVSKGEAVAALVASVPAPAPPRGDVDDVGDWVRATSLGQGTAKVERPYAPGWRELLADGGFTLKRSGRRSRRPRNFNRGHFSA